MDTTEFGRATDERRVARKITKHPIYQQAREAFRKAEADLIAKVKRLETALAESQARVEKLAKKAKELGVDLED